MNGTAGPLSQDLLGLAPVAGRGLLHLKNAEGTPWGRQAAQPKENGPVSEAWVTRSTDLDGPIPSPTSPSSKSSRDLHRRDPGTSTHVALLASGAGGEGGITSKQLLGSERMPVPRSSVLRSSQ